MDEEVGDVSIRSPHRSEGRSNAIAELEESVYAVSIRSPHRSEGRFQRSVCKVLRLQFQSAPPTEVRGDPTSDQNRAHSRRFNPLPPPK